MGNIVSFDAPDSYVSVARTLDFFAQKYRDDTAFARSVDESLLRILNLKYRLYGSFSLAAVQPSETGLEVLGQSSENVFTIARQSATLISPPPADFASVLPAPPNVLDYLVFLTDARTIRQCSTCPDKLMLSNDAMHSAVQRLYGPSSSGLVTPSHLSSFSFDDLNLLLDDRLTTPDMINALGRATWIVISTLDLPEGSPQLTTLRRFLSEKQSLLSNKKVILFSFSAPYYLDATDISKLTAYYGMYSVSDPFVDVAARLLFQEISPAGSLPVSVLGIGYDLSFATAPDPAQVISLSYDMPKINTPEPTGEITATPPFATLTLSPTVEPLFRVGDTMSLRTGTIVDRNQRPVPDGTPVRFTLSQGESGLIQQVESQTTLGVAVASFRLDQPGLIEIHASSESAKVSNTIQLNVTKEGATVIIITPTSVATVEPTPTQPAPTPTPIVSPLVTRKSYPTIWGWLLVLFVMVSGVALTYWLAGQMVDPRWTVRWSLLVLAGGLIAYNYLVLGFPLGDLWLGGRGLPAFLQAVLIGQSVGFAIGWFWRLASESGNQAQ